MSDYDKIVQIKKARPTTVSRELNDESLVGTILCERTFHKAQRQVVETASSWLCGLCA